MIVLGIGEIAVTAEPGHVLCTRLLGARVAVLCHSPSTGAAGMLHAAFPRSSSDPVQATVMPGIYADTGVETLMGRLRRFCDDGFRDLSIVVVGGGDAEAGQHGHLGAENVSAVARALTGFGLECGCEVLGGGYCRTVNLEAGTGRVRITAAALSHAASPAGP